VEFKVRINVYSLRLVKESSHNYKVEGTVQSPETASEVINEIFDLCNLASEVFAIVCLNTKNKIAGAHIISQGSLNSTIVHPREVFKAAILNNASAIILSHNHPSGDPDPSQEDIETTKRLVEAGKILGIGVLDHIIIAENKHYSLKQAGHI
jgi:DNA repair protein RadC